MSTRTFIARRAVALVFLSLMVLVSGCYERRLAPAVPCTSATVDLRVTPNSVDTVDLLLMVDNSNSMAGEQDLLGLELPRMIRVLASGDRDEDGVADFPALRSLHVGIVTSDMGAGPALPAGETVPSCDAGLGDDGILRSAGVAARPGCVATYPTPFDFRPDDLPTPDEFANDVACVAVMGTGGCGFEQQLEAVLKAVSAASPTADYVAGGYVPPIFAGGTLGHGDGANAGFIRRESALALLLVTDEEDCSVPDYSLFYRDPRFTSVGLNLRCHSFASELYPIERYVEGFLQLRDNPALLLYAGLAGVPTDIVGNTVEAYDTMLADPRMQEIPDASATPPVRLNASCRTADGGEAFPPRRMVRVARGLSLAGVGTTMQSICASDFRPAIDEVLALIENVLDGACLPRPLNTASDGTVDCDVLELLPASSDTGAPVTCAELGDFAEPLGVEIDETTGLARELCRIPQLSPSDAETGAQSGWYYDHSAAVVARCGGSNPPGQRISFARHAPPRGAEVRLSCSQNVLRGEGGAGVPVAQLGTFCSPGPETPGVATADNVCPGAVVPTGADTNGDGAPDRLSCDLLTRACQVRCRTDADCVASGLASSVCDLRPTAVVTGGAVPDGLDPAAPYAICVNPVCG